MASWFETLGRAEQTLIQNKVDSVNKASNTKQAEMEGFNTLSSLEDFRAAFPQATPVDEQVFLKNQQRENQFRNTGVAEDIVTGVGIALGDNLPMTLAGAVGLITGSEEAFNMQHNNKKKLQLPERITH